MSKRRRPRPQDPGNNSAPPDGMRWEYKKPPDIEMRAFDALPRALRDRLNYACLNFSAYSVRQKIAKKGRPVRDVLNDVIAGDRLAARLIRREYGINDD